MQCVILPETSASSGGLLIRACEGRLRFFPTPQEALVGSFQVFLFFRVAFPGLGKQHGICTTLLLTIAQMAYGGLEKSIF